MTFVQLTFCSTGIVQFLKCSAWIWSIDIEPFYDMVHMFCILLIPLAKQHRSMAHVHDVNIFHALLPYLMVYRCIWRYIGPKKRPTLEEKLCVKMEKNQNITLKFKEMPQINFLKRYFIPHLKVKAISYAYAPNSNKPQAMSSNFWW